MSTQVLSVELTEGLHDYTNLKDYSQVMVLIRSQGRPLGRLVLPVEKGSLKATDIWAAIEADGDLNWQLSQATLKNWLLQNQPLEADLPSWSVIVCTRDRTEDLRRCLDGLLKLKGSGGEIVIVDNAPSDDQTARLVADYPVRYVREDRPGLNWARSRGALAASGEVVIYTDDDVVVDPNWVMAMIEPFGNPRVAAVTGLTMPLELETRAQELFEFNYGGFGRGFRRKVYDYTNMVPAAAGRCGAGANMALRRELVNKLGLFDVELDCGTIAQTGGDAYAFYQLLTMGYQVVYSPEALVWHRHRRDYKSLRKTIAGYSVGGYAFLARCWFLHGDWQAVKVGVSWFRNDHLKQLKRSLKRNRGHLPLDLSLAQIGAIPKGFQAYFTTRKQERATAKQKVVVEPQPDSLPAEPIGGRR